MNPINGKKYSEKYYEIKNLIDKLPVSQPDVVDEFKKKLDLSNVIVIESSTGSGKSVKSPLIAYEHYNYDVNIIITQPRTVTIEPAANYMSAQLDTTVPDPIGFVYGAGSKTSNKTNIYIVTDTVYQRMDKKFEISSYPLNDGKRPPIIFLDEMHERSIPMDIIMSNMYTLYQKNSEVPVKLMPKLILLSATIDIEYYISYFERSGAKVSSMTIIGTPKPLGHIFLTSETTTAQKPDVKKASNLVLDTVKKLITGNFDFTTVDVKISDTPDILVFMPTVSPIVALVRSIENWLKEIKQYNTVLVGALAGVVPLKERQFLISSRDVYGKPNAYKRFHERPDPKKRIGPFKRKILISTDIAKTGITIVGIEIVIDSGLENVVYFNARQMKKIQYIGFANQASVIQRSGRAGRKDPGIALHLYSKDEFKKFRKYARPQIESSDYIDLLKSMLQLRENIDNVMIDVINMPTPPNKKLLEKTILDFYEWGILHEGKMTPKGLIASNFGVDLMLGLLLVNSVNNHCVRSMLPIVAFIATNKNLKNWDIKIDQRYGAPISFLKLWNFLYRTFIKKHIAGRRHVFSQKDPDKRLWYLRRLRRWCKQKNKPYDLFRNFINILLKIQSRFRRFRRTLPRTKDLKPDETVTIFERIIITFSRTFKNNRLININKNRYKILKTGEEFNFRLGFKTFPKMLGYYDIIYSSMGPRVNIPFVTLESEPSSE